MVDRVDSIVRGAAEAYEVKGRWTKAGEAAVMNSDIEADAIVETAAKSEGQKLCYFDKVGGSDDCSLLQSRAQKLGAKATFFLWGCDQKGHHRPDFDIQDTETLPRAIAVLADIVKKTNGLAL